jgi:hypothetical protein
MPAIIIGDIDTGLDYAGNNQVWINQGEIPKGLPIKDVDGDLVITFKDLNAPFNAPYVKDGNGNQIIDGKDLLLDPRWANGSDDDRNGYVDDLVGWNFVRMSNDATDDVGHGSWVAGLIASTGGPSVYVVPVKVFGVVPTSALPQALDYFTSLSSAARSRGGAERYVATTHPYNVPFFDWSKQVAALANAAKSGALFIAAAGNDPNANNDMAPRYPAGLSSYTARLFDAVTSVTTVDNYGSLAGNYGRYSVDLAVSGGTTSAAVAYAAGYVAEYALKWPAATAQQIKAALLASTDSHASLVGRTVSGGVLDAGSFLSRPPVTLASSGGETLIGTLGGDRLDGTPGHDMLIGHPDDYLGRPVASEVDKLTGGAGSDLFMIGNAERAFYALGGTSDFALIEDFSIADRLGVYGAFADYELRDVSAKGASGVGVYRKSDGEFLALIKGKSSGQLSSADFIGTR